MVGIVVGVNDGSGVVTKYSIALHPSPSDPALVTGLVPVALFQALFTLDSVN
jgi:hypothetical protein